VRSETGKRGPSPYSVSIDRIKHHVGYYPHNCRFVLHAVNTMRGSGTDAEMNLIARALINNL
jgi:hypothetical protein